MEVSGQFYTPEAKYPRQNSRMDHPATVWRFRNDKNILPLSSIE